MFLSSSAAVGFWAAIWLVGLAILATALVPKLRRSKKGTEPKDAFAPFIDDEGQEWRRTITEPPPWRR